MFNWYCPQMWGPTDDELAKMAPEDRLVALLDAMAGFRVNDPAQAVRSAKSICSQLDAGSAMTSVVDSVHAANKDVTRWTYDTSRTDS